jgi:hypothetical protein
MIDINKKYRTRACAEVRIYAVDVDGAWPVHGAFKSPAGWVVSCWRQDGTQLDLGGHYDLIELKPRIQRTVWLALYPLDDVWVVSGDCTAVEKGCLACVKVEIDCEEGEGL